MYEKETLGILVKAEPQYLAEESDPEDHQYFWAYTIQITNQRKDAVHLRSRFWNIMNAKGVTQEVSGPGVVGEEPLIEPGSSFVYTSGCPLDTSSGFMVGRYTMQDATGDFFEIDIPAFSLDIPDEKPVLN